MFGAVQVRAARAVLGWSIKDLAQRTELHPNTIGRFERGEDSTKGTLALLRMTFEKAGVAFGNEGSIHPPVPSETVEAASE